MSRYLTFDDNGQQLAVSIDSILRVRDVGDDKTQVTVPYAGSGCQTFTIDTPFLDIMLILSDGVGYRSIDYYKEVNKIEKASNPSEGSLKFDNKMDILPVDNFDKQLTGRGGLSQSPSGEVELVPVKSLDKLAKDYKATLEIEKFVHIYNTDFVVLNYGLSVNEIKQVSIHPSNHRLIIDMVNGETHCIGQYDVPRFIIKFEELRKSDKFSYLLCSPDTEAVLSDSPIAVDIEEE